jgi:hypothetical protein
MMLFFLFHPIFLVISFTLSTAVCKEHLVLMISFSRKERNDMREQEKKGRLHGNGMTQDYGIDASVLISWEAMK